MAQTNAEDPKSLTCFKCKQHLHKIGKFFDVEGGHQLCAPCMDDAFGHECFHCHKEIQQYSAGEKQVSSKDGTKHWHDFCFVCSKCGAMVAEVPFYPGKSKNDDERYCGECLDNISSSTCAKCQQLIMRYAKGEKEILSQDGSKHWHSTCFACYNCNESLVGKGYYPKDGGLYCETCVKSPTVSK